MISPEGDNVRFDDIVADLETDFDALRHAAAECAWQVSPRPREFDAVINPPKGTVSPGHIAFRAAHMEAQTEL